MKFIHIHIWKAKGGATYSSDKTRLHHEYNAEIENALYT